MSLGSLAKPLVPTETEAPTSNARLIAELQAVTIGIHLVGLDRLPEVMRDGKAVRS